MPFRVILVEVIKFRHQLPAADGAIRRIERHVPRLLLREPLLLASRMENEKMYSPAL